MRWKFKYIVQIHFFEYEMSRGLQVFSESPEQVLRPSPFLNHSLDFCFYKFCHKNKCMNKCAFSFEYNSCVRVSIELHHKLTSCRATGPLFVDQTHGLFINLRDRGNAKVEPVETMSRPIRPSGARLFLSFSKEAKSGEISRRCLG